MFQSALTGYHSCCPYLTVEFGSSDPYYQTEKLAANPYFQFVVSFSITATGKTEAQVETTLPNRLDTRMSILEQRSEQENS